MIPSGAPEMGAVVLGFGMLLNVAGFAAIAVVANLCLLWFGWQGLDLDADAGWLEPPFWVVGTVWVVLVAMLGVARWSVSQARASRVRRWIDALGLLCCVIPFYALTSDNQALNVAANIAIGLIAVAVLMRARAISRLAAALIVPVPVWLCFASATVLLN